MAPERKFSGIRAASTQILKIKSLTVLQKTPLETENLRKSAGKLVPVDGELLDRKTDERGHNEQGILMEDNNKQSAGKFGTSKLCF